MTGTRLTTLAIFMLVVAGLAASAASSDTVGVPAPHAQTIRRVSLVVDATDSVNTPIPGGVTRREAYLAAARSIIRATQRAGLSLAVARTCGITEPLWDAPVTRKDFATLTALIDSALKSCDGRTSAVTSAQRGAGTDLVKGLDWLARQPEGSLLIAVTDGIHTMGRNPTAEFLRALDCGSSAWMKACGTRSGPESDTLRACSICSPRPSSSPRRSRERRNRNGPFDCPSLHRRHRRRPG
jgi:hypothetical protein